MFRWLSFRDSWLLTPLTDKLTRNHESASYVFRQAGLTILSPLGQGNKVNLLTDEDLAGPRGGYGGHYTGMTLFTSTHSLIK